jgi:23S rRNA (adenine2030-N6)-methyltransferase
MVNAVDAPREFDQSIPMNYRHAYHAGNHGDVLKHAILARLLTYLTIKDKPLALLDAHAGIGRYDLSGVEAFKTGEWQDGIGKLLANPLPPLAEALLKPYLDIVRALNPSGKLQHYPGSPEIAKTLLRVCDRMIFNDLHAEDRHTLAHRFANDLRITVTGVDALQAIKSSLPFAERRGLLLIDPAYEVPDETERVARMVQHALRRMNALTIMVWYPVTTAAFADTLCQVVTDESGNNAALDVRLMVKEDHKDAGLSGSGLVLINPPWTLHDEATTIAQALATNLGKGKWGKGSVRWLTPPK